MSSASVYDVRNRNSHDSSSGSAQSGRSQAEGRKDGTQKTRRWRRYRPRTCRICLESVHPTFPDAASNGILGSIGSFAFDGRPTYVSEDPELGRLFSPCKCKGSQRHVHQGCLEAWRKASPNTSNYWQCNICKFQYRFSRISWASYLRSTLTQLALTLAVFLALIFILGFFADVILSMWVDPIGTVVDTVNLARGADAFETPPPPLGESNGWLQHWLKGFFSFGILGFVKVALTLSPLHWWNLRSSGILGIGRRPTVTGSRARMENINILLVLAGAVTFLVAIWKAIQKLSGLVMDRLADSVLDIGEDDDDDEEEEEEEEKQNADAIQRMNAKTLPERDAASAGKIMA